MFGFYEKLRDWWLVENGAGRLRQLDNRLLADIGVDRRNIDRFVRGRLPLEPAPMPKPRVVVGSPHPRIPRQRAAGRNPAFAYAPRRSRATDLENAE